MVQEASPAAICPNPVKGYAFGLSHFWRIKKALDEYDQGFQNQFLIAKLLGGVVFGCICIYSGIGGSCFRLSFRFHAGGLNQGTT